MASGDIVGGISGADTTINFQPAATVNVCITWINGSPTGSGMSLYNGAISSSTDTFTNLEGGQLSIKMMIDNTNYLSIAGQGGASRAAYTGIEI